MPVDGLRIGAVQLDGRAILAPMAGVTDVGMRRVARLTGASLTVSEMVAASNYARGERLSRSRAAGAGLDIYAVQIAGRRPDEMALAARMAEADGAALIDINMGCPARKVTGGYGGAALMRDLDLATALILAVTATVRVPVTVKMRLGWDAAHNASELARRAEAAGVAAVTVHGRTRCQFYSGRADWGAVAAVKAAVSIPVIVNGDATNVASARAMLAASGADAVMIGRAAVGRPWLVGEIAAALRGAPRPSLSVARRAELARAHYASILADMGVESGIRHARKHLAAYAQHAGWAPEEPRRATLVRSTSPDEVRDLLDEMFCGLTRVAA